MVGPRPGGTAFLITVAPTPGTKEHPDPAVARDRFREQGRKLKPVILWLPQIQNVATIVYEAIHPKTKREMNEKKKGKLVAPDGGWGWIVVLGVGLVNLSTRSIEPSFGLLFHSLLQELSIATTGAGIIFSTYEAVVSFSGIFVGPLIKTYSYRKIAFLGSILTAFGLIITFPAYSMAHILITYSIIVGLGVGFSSSATFVSINYYFRERRGQAVGIAMTGTGLGLLLMPQAVRYLTEEYDFAGSILIIGAFALNACVGSAVLQPVKWHLKEVKEDEEKMINPNDSEVVLQSRPPTCPQITIENTIEEELDGEEENHISNNQNSVLSLESQGKAEEKLPTRRVSEFRPRFYLSKPYRKFSLTDKEWSNQDALFTEQKNFIQKPLNKSSTEVKFDKYFDETGGRNFFYRRQWSESPGVKYNSSSFSISNKQETQHIQTPSSTIRKRKSSTISNLSNLDFTGSCLHLHAIENELRDEGVEMGKSEAEETVGKTEETMWQRFSAFMDFDLLKDPIYLNILFGVSIFYVAEANFKMVVPFFLADLGHTKKETAFCLSMMAAADIAARLILPPICDRVKISRRTSFLVAAIFCGLSRSALAESLEWIQLETILIISGFFRGATLINFMLVIPEYCDQKINKLPAALGIHMVAKGIFIVSLGPLIGLVRDLTNSYPICIHVQNVLIALCAIAWIMEYLIVKRPKPGHLIKNNT